MIKTLLNTLFILFAFNQESILFVHFELDGLGIHGTHGGPVCIKLDIDIWFEDCNAVYLACKDNITQKYTIFVAWTNERLTFGFYFLHISADIGGGIGMY